MNDVLGIINTISCECSLQELTQHRPLATVPFGGRYRLIDFALSGMYNSGITNIGLLTPLHQRSIFDHIRTGTGWNRAGKIDNITWLPPGYEQLRNGQSKEIASFYSNLDYFKHSPQNYAIITPGGVISNFNFQDALQFHRDTGADVTLLYKKQGPEEYDCDNHMNLNLAVDGRVLEIDGHPSANHEGNCFWGAFVLHKERLMGLIKECFHNGTESLSDAMALKLKEFNIRAYYYPGFLARIHCLHSYYRHNMALLNPDIWQELFRQPDQIHTKARDETPAKYGAEAEVSQAIIGSGCFIQGTVDHSILFRQVTVQRRAQIKDSILMSNTRIAEGAVLEYVICDKDVQVGPGQSLRGRPDQPLLIKKGTVI